MGYQSEAGPRQKCKTLPEKITEAKKTWGVAQVAQCLPNKHEALSSNTAKGEKNKNVQLHFHLEPQTLSCNCSIYLPLPQYVIFLTSILLLLLPLTLYISQASI
jgi:hypothetical protein